MTFRVSATRFTLVAACALAVVMGASPAAAQPAAGAKTDAAATDDDIAKKAEILRSSRWQIGRAHV